MKFTKTLQTRLTGLTATLLVGVLALWAVTAPAQQPVNMSLLPGGQPSYNWSGLTNSAAQCAWLVSTNAMSTNLGLVTMVSGTNAYATNYGGPACALNGRYAVLAIGTCGIGTNANAITLYFQRAINKQATLWETAYWTNLAVSVAAGTTNYYVYQLDTQSDGKGVGINPTIRLGKILLHANYFDPAAGATNAAKIIRATLN